MSLALELKSGIEEIDLELLNRHPIVVLRGQKLDKAKFVALAQKLGEIDTRMGREPVVTVSAESAEMDAHRELPWHQDLSFLKEPPRWVLLYADEIEGDSVTEWCDHVRATASLPPELLASYRALRWEHAALNIARLESFPFKVGDGAEKRWLRRAKTSHPAVVKDPRGQEYLNFNSGYVALEPAMQSEVEAHLYRGENIYSHRWQKGDLVISNNLATSHRRSAVPTKLKRRLFRIQLM